MANEFLDFADFEEMRSCLTCAGTGEVRHLNSVKLGEQLRKTRNDSNVLLRHIATNTGKSISYWSDLEHGRKCWTTLLVLEFLTALQLTALQIEERKLKKGKQS